MQLPGGDRRAVSFYEQRCVSLFIITNIIVLPARGGGGPRETDGNYAARWVGGQQECMNDYFNLVTAAIRFYHHRNAAGSKQIDAFDGGGELSSRYAMEEGE